jgi:FkbH-like protein
MYLPEDFDYIKLMSLGRQANAALGSRVAILGFCTTDYYAHVLKGLGTVSGFPIVTYESEYDTVHQTVLDENSGLYAFGPDFVVIVTAVQALRTILLPVDLNRRVETAEEHAEQLVATIERTARIPEVTVVVNEFVLPYERAWGNLTRRISGSLLDVVTRVNERLREAADRLPNVYTVETDRIASWIGKQDWFDERLWFYSKSFCHPGALPRVAGEALDVFRAVKGKGVKCIALDLDNVLWGGTIGEDGLDGIRLGELGEGEAFVHFQTWLKDLRDRGIILGVASKNDDEKAREPFRSHTDMVLKETDISCFIANWDDKAQSVREVAARLNIGLESIVFLDDSPFERNLVRDLVPDVLVPELPSDPAEYVPYLESLNLFEATQFSAEDRKRADFYRTNVLRQTEQARFANVEEYLASLEMEAAFERFDEHHLPRIAQLVQRTNQFNLTTIRHSAAELIEFAEDSTYLPYYVALSDRFGDNGLISVVIAKRDDDVLDIVTWLMSCRVISRRVEEFVLDRLVEVAREAGIGRLRGRYVPTKKNGLVSDHYEKLGFVLTESNRDGTTSWHLDVDEYVPSDAPIGRKVLVGQ